MSKFYSFNNFNNNLTLDFGFKYNRYEEKETLNNHNIILSSNAFNNKEIFLSINVNIDYAKNPLKHTSELNYEYLLSLNDKTINDHQLEFFNNLNQKKDFAILNQAFSKEKIKSVYDFFGTNYINFEEDFDKNKKINVDRNKIDYIENCNTSNMFFEKNSFIENDMDELYSNKTESKSFIENNQNFISDLVPYNRKNIYDEPEIYFSFVGFFIEKYLKEDDSYSFLDRKFYIDNEINNVENKRFNRKTLNIKDKGIRYGQTYKYKVCPVYSITFPKFNDFHIVEDYLYCDVPYFTKDIVCKEKLRPLPPNNIRFRYKKKTENIVITWNLVPDTVGDIKGFQIFKRSSLSDPYVLIKQIEYHNKYDFYEKNNLINNSYIEERKEIDSFEFETKFKKSKIEMYTICSIDAHGFVSNYSSQLGVKYNYAAKKLEIDLVSRSGAPINMPNLLVGRKTKFYNNDEKIATITPMFSKTNKISIYATPDFATINTDDLQENNIYTYKEKYKINIFKLENSENFIDTIKIVNFNI
jgi:hypothetical protein